MISKQKNTEIGKHAGGQSPELREKARQRLEVMHNTETEGSGALTTDTIPELATFYENYYVDHLYPKQELTPEELTEQDILAIEVAEALQKESLTQQEQMRLFASVTEYWEELSDYNNPIHDRLGHKNEDGDFNKKYNETMLMIQYHRQELFRRFAGEGVELPNLPPTFNEKDIPKAMKELWIEEGVDKDANAFSRWIQRSNSRWSARQYSESDFYDEYRHRVSVRENKYAANMEKGPEMIGKVMADAVMGRTKEKMRREIESNKNNIQNHETFLANIESAQSREDLERIVLEVPQLEDELRQIVDVESPQTAREYFLERVHTSVTNDIAERALRRDELLQKENTILARANDLQAQLKAERGKGNKKDRAREQRLEDQLSIIESLDRLRQNIPGALKKKYHEIGLSTLESHVPQRVREQFEDQLASRYGMDERPANKGGGLENWKKTLAQHVEKDKQTYGLLELLFSFITDFSLQPA